LSYITLNKKAFFNNADYYSNLLGNKDKLCIALKDNAYGHGLSQVGQLCLEYGIKHCMVRDIEEANIASQYSFETILILYDRPTKAYPSNYIFTINSLDDISSYSPNTKVELKIDTGMSRNGIYHSQIDEALKLISKNNLILNGVFTHFCCADVDTQDDITKKQEENFLNSIKYIKTKVDKPFKIHCSNTAGVHKANNSLYDMARIGIGLYGYSQPVQKYLKPILSLWANKISTRTLQKGDGIGYGSSYKIEENNTIVSNYDIGYGDGFFRIDENQKVFVKNSEQILGRISMDSFSIKGDVSEICIFDNVINLIKIHNTIEYEIFTHLMPRIKRHII